MDTLIIIIYLLRAIHWEYISSTNELIQIYEAYINVTTPAAIVLPEFLNINLPSSLQSEYNSKQTGRDASISNIAVICFVRHLHTYIHTYIHTCIKYINRVGSNY